MDGTERLRIGYVDDDTQEYRTREFDLVVLSAGLEPPREARELAERFGVELNRHGFARTLPFDPVATSREGIVFRPGPGGRVNLVVMIVTDEKAPGAYLQVLAAVVRTFADMAKIRKVAQLNTAARVWQFFDRGAEALPEFVTAADMMSADFPRMRQTDTLAMAIDCFCRTRAGRIAVVDDDGDFVGVVGEDEILRLSMPEYILWLNDLTPILQVEPFAETLKNEHVTRLAEIMSTDIVSVEEKTPAVQVARVLRRADVQQVFVKRGRKVVGLINASDFLQRVFRG
jgi:CBS domain-containing protein